MESQTFFPKCDLGSTTSDNGFGTFGKVHDFLNLFLDSILHKPAPPPPCLTAVELTFFNYLSSSNIEIWEKGEIWELY